LSIIIFSSERSRCPNRLGTTFQRPWHRFAAVVVMLCTTAALADESPAPQDATPQRLETVVVTGAQPGPGLWKVSKDDHVLWILGTLSPLPKKMQWLAREVEATIAESQEVLLAPAASLSVDTGFFGGLMLLPALIGARDNPDGATLAEVVPADLYARWLVQKQRFFPRDRAVEKRRPLFAAQTLYQEALGHSGLTFDNMVAPVVTKAAKRHGVVLTRPELKLKLEQPKQAVREFKRDTLDDVACFRITLERVETDLDAMKARANAWAVGDIAALRALPFNDQRPACENAFLQAGAVQKRGLDDLRPRLRQLWLAAAQAALAKNATSFALLPMSLLLDPDGYLSALAAQGYAIEEP
jgi:uncharacterized protein YbaP (TraB family)